MSVAAQLSQRIHGVDVFAGFVPTFAEDMQGWNSRAGIFSEIISSARSQVVIDVGVWKGASTIYLAQLLREHGIDGAVIAVDTFLGSPEHWITGTAEFDLIPRRHGIPLLYEQFLSNVVRNQVRDLIVPFAQTSQNAALILRRQGISADLVHIDAAHDYESVLHDARAYWDILAPNGFLLGDDYHVTWPGVVAGANQFAKEVGVKLEVSMPKWIVRKPG